MPFAIDIAKNGQEAVDVFKQVSYDLVFMDIQMPIKDGYTATKEIREWELEQRRKPTPIIALTAYALKEDREKSIEAGCNDHLTKPIKKIKILEIIDKYLE